MNQYGNEKPTLTSFSEILTGFDVENLIFSAKPSIFYLDKLPSRFLAELKIQNRYEFVLVENEDSENITIPNFRTLNKKEFVELWSGNVLLIESDEKIRSSKRLSSIIYFTYFFVFCIIFSIFSGQSYSKIFFFTLSIAGLYISYLIVKTELNYPDSVADKICNISSLSDCRGFLKIYKINIIQNYGLGDLAFCYFLTLVITMITSFSIPGVVSLTLLSLMPLTFLLIVFQLFYIKKWCALCLGLTGLIWCLFSLDFFFLQNSMSISSRSDFSILFLFFCINVIWFPLKMGLLQLGYHKLMSSSFLRFKRKEEYFKNLLNGSSELIKSNFESKLILGNRKAKNEISLITNPKCSYCRTVHQHLKKIAENDDNFCLDIKFNIDYNIKGEAYNTAHLLIQIYEKLGSKNFAEAIDEAFSANFKYDKWSKKYSENHDQNECLLIKQHRDWALQNGFNSTPVILINNKKVPNIYSIKEIVFFLNNHF